MKLRIATRRSALALVQSRWVVSELQRLSPGLEVELVEVITQGDRIQDRPLADIGGKGLFVSEVEDVLLRGEAEVAVHSLKDVPAELAPGLMLGAVPPREDPSDVLVTLDGAALDDLEAGSRVGTNSLRRQLQLRGQRNDLDYAMLRGNVDTRLRKLAEGEYRAIVLAAAGLNRLGLKPASWAIPTEISVPSVGQGALAVECRVDDQATRVLLAKLDHAPSRACVEAERAFLARLGGDCHTPIGGHCSALAERIRFEGWVGSETQSIRASSDVWGGLEMALKAADEVAHALLMRGAREMIGAAKGPDPRRH